MHNFALAFPKEMMYIVIASRILKGLLIKNKLYNSFYILKYNLFWRTSL